ncbi:expressed unknown protein [Seminavis robusta]|uniref:Uncharacterized protein n=1 Tax=Seminavis robusta TaxID=568900 RepID=A0A9N8EWV1_9STRA|nr:expressed unknown protein [Seminavis robusta]|eukprot:Sro1996_g310070.1 n/a (422) ;mRNA; r:13578-14843
MSDDSNADNKSMFNLERFSLFLASNLAGGSKQLEDCLDLSISNLPPPAETATNTNASTVSFPVYWRSPLLHPGNSSCFFQESKIDDSVPDLSSRDQQEMDLIYLDVTVLFRTQFSSDGNDANDDDNHNGKENALNSSISVVFGAFLRQTKNSDNDSNDSAFYHYIQGPAVKTESLDDHVSEHGISLEDTAPLPIANPMWRALKRLSSGTLAKITKQSESGMLHEIRVPLFYEDDDNEVLTGPSYLTISNRSGPSSPLSSPVASTMICSILSHDQSKQVDKKNKKPNDGEQSKIEKEPMLSKKNVNKLLSKYGEWKDKTATWLQDVNAARQQHKRASMENDNEANNKKDASPAKGAASQQSPSSKPPKPSPKESKQKPSDGNDKSKKKRPNARYGVQRIGGRGGNKKKKQKTASFAALAKKD